MFKQFEEKGKVFTKVVSKDPIKVHIQTLTHLIRGKVHIKPDERIKDELNADEEFLAVTDAVVYDTNEMVLHRTAFLAVNRAHIVWIYPDTEIKKQMR
jgi:hypothetical protein